MSADTNWGVVFPQLEIGTNPALVREYAQTAERRGYDHLLAFDHILSVNSASRPGWEGYYDHEDPFHEVMVLFGYLAAVTNRMTLATGVLVLPQRKAPTVAKQATELDILSGGRFVLGVGVGWNEVEMEALGEDFGTRGRRIEEQIDVLHELWANELVTFEGEYHDLPDLGLNPLPPNREIPLWIGGDADPVLRRAARVSDAWIPQKVYMGPDYDRERLADRFATLDEYLEAAGRDRSDIDIVGRIGLGSRDPEQWFERYDDWLDVGATHVSVDTMSMGLESPREHIETVEWFMDEAEARGL
jgi:probable F420-dependent oxidoreductase